MSGVLPLDDATLHGVAARAPGTAADHVPVVLHHDVIEGSWSRRIRHLDFRSLYIAERGRGLHVIDATSYAISRGDVYVMNTGSDHAFTSGERLFLRTIHFSDSIFDTPTWQTLSAMPGFDTLLLGQSASRLHLSPSAYADIARDLAEIWAEWHSGTPASAMLVRALLLRLLVRLARVASGEPPPTPHQPQPTVHREEIVAAALRAIDVNYAEPLRVRELAASVYLSPDRFTEIFTSVAGRTPRDYIRHVRLEHAKTLLASSTISISDIAHATGFHDSAYFSRTFRAETGHSPRQYREKFQPWISAAARISAD